MAKKIKKQIKRSMPLFVIVSLLFANVAFGLVFDFNISVERISNGVNVKIVTNEEAKAQVTDTATTTVTVRNNPPNITVAPAENPVSASTTPVNMWANLQFTVTADDDENNDYYLIVCSSDSASAGAGGGAPTCGATQFCVSGLTLDTNQASCTYTNVQDPGAESQEWYAFVCDDHATEAECIFSGNQGSGESGSPFWVNHPPYFTAVSTTVDNQDPGGTFQITASVADPDVASSADFTILNVCSSNSWATTTGCADTTFCTGTSTSGGDVTCSFATSTPAMDGTYTYYAFVRDYHFLAATTTQSSNYSVNNVAPQVSSVELTNGLDIYLNFKGESGVNATTTGTISDNNGCVDINYATGSVYWSGVTDLYNCQPDDNNCYQIAQADCTLTSGSCTGASDTDLEYTCSTTLAFHALPTDGSSGNPNAGTWWLGAIRGFDEALDDVGTSTADLTDVMTATALEVEETQIPYGSIRGGQDSGDANATTTVDNYGNSPINTDFTGDDMDRQGGGGYVGVNNQLYATTTFTYAAGPGIYELSSSSPQWVTRDLELDRPTTTSFTVFDKVYWGIGIPAGKLSGIYEGTNYFRSSLDGTGVGW